MMDAMAAEEWSTAEHVLRYLARADTLPHRTEGASKRPDGEARRLDLHSAVLASGHLPDGSQDVPGIARSAALFLVAGVD